VKRITRTAALIAGVLGGLALTLLAADSLLDFTDRLPYPVSTIARIAFGAAFLVLIYILVVAADPNDSD
jgi:hypothetical protein